VARGSVVMVAPPLSLDATPDYWRPPPSLPPLSVLPPSSAGMPGTGKTATVREVVRQLHQRHLESSLPPFQYIEVNAMHLANPYQLYSVLWKQLSDHETTPQRALRVRREWSTHTWVVDGGAPPSACGAVSVRAGDCLPDRVPPFPLPPPPSCLRIGFRRPTPGVR
jgi:Cdc6-like AAA superfamily ATPase